MFVVCNNERDYFLTSSDSFSPSERKYLNSVTFFDDGLTKSLVEIARLIKKMSVIRGFRLATVQTLATGKPAVQPRFYKWTRHDPDRQN